MSAPKSLPRPCPTCGDVSLGVFCPTDGTPLAGSFTIGGDRYVVDELIGNGAMAIVFGGNHRTLSRPVAVKVLRPEVARNEEQQQRFLREARSASKLSHENIVGVLDFGWDDELGVTYMVMERLFGETLATELAQHGRMPWRDAIWLLAQIARGVAAAHAAGIVHRDLGPRNVILVSSAGRRVAKLCDFGLSRHTEGGDRVTQNGEWVGTPAYMAPEQSESSVVEPSADVYSMGALAYEMLTGHVPVGGVHPIEVLASKLDEEIGSISSRYPDLGVPEELDALVLRCLSHEPAARPTAAEVERALVRLEARATSLGAQPGSMPAIAVPRTLTPSLPTLEDGSPSMIGSYRVVRSLGMGGTGRVYLGEHPVIGTKVAIKVLLPEIAGSKETVDRFIQEARSSSQIDSPHIPRYYDFGRTPGGGLPYAVMEYFEGKTLAEHIEEVGPLSVAQTAGILAQVTGALALAHKAGLVHRDLKPENLFLVAAEARAATNADGGVTRAATSSGSSSSLFESAFSVKVLDFGIAKSFGKESGTRTQQGFFLGTPFYCAPEQVFGHEVDPRADVYALGVTAFEMLTGMPPFVGEISEVLEAKTARDAPLLRSVRPDLPERVERTIAAMLARDLGARAESMQWVRDQLELWGRPDEEPERAADEDDPDALISTGRLLSPAAVARARTSLPATGAVGSALGAESSGPLVLGDLDDGGAGTGRSGRLPRSTSAAEPFVVAAERRRPSAVADPDLDALETITLRPGSRPAIAYPPAAQRAWWQRPAVLALAVASLVGIAAVGLVVGGSEEVSAQVPKVTPIDPRNAAPLQAQREPAAPPSETTTERTTAPTQPDRGGVGSSDPADTTVADPREDERAATSRKGKRGKKKPGRDDKDSKVVKPADPPPPKDVKLVDPFATKP